MRDISRPLLRAFGRSFRQARMDAGLSQSDIAGITKAHQTNISAIERGVKDITVGTMAIMARAVGFRLSVEWHPIGRQKPRKRSR
jgi:transcriptional regulator with XRE-family HTH domain